MNCPVNSLNLTSNPINHEGIFQVAPMKIRFSFTGTLWRSKGPGGWHFVSLPVEMSEEIRALLRNEEAGWGRLNITAITGKTRWKTAIWFDTKRNTYLLPLKAEIRKKEKLSINSSVEVTLEI